MRWKRCSGRLRPLTAPSVHAREEQVKQETARALCRDRSPSREREIADALYYLDKEVMRRKIIDHGVRPDGRALTEVRPIWCEAGVLPRTHGSAVFTRGQTQVMSICHPRLHERCADAGRHLLRKNPSAICTITTCRRYSTGEAKSAAQLRAAARSATARWLSARWSP